MKVFVVADDAETVEFISIAFDTGWPGASVVSAKVNTAPELLESESPDLVITEINSHDADSFDVLRQMRQSSTAPVIIVSARDSEADIVKGLEWGADEYIVKPFGQQELLARVKAVLRSRLFSRELDYISILGAHRLDSSTGQLKCGSKSIYLTRTEAIILRLLMRKYGQVVTYTELAEALWGIVYPNSTDTLRVYVRRLRAKLEEESLKIYIKSRAGIGYYLQLAD
jgi:two-component system, OmpR family, response regulator VicR